MAVALMALAALFVVALACAVVDAIYAIRQRPGPGVAITALITLIPLLAALFVIRLPFLIMSIVLIDPIKEAVTHLWNVMADTYERSYDKDS